MWVAVQDAQREHWRPRSKAPVAQDGVRSCVCDVLLSSFESSLPKKNHPC